MPKRTKAQNKAIREKMQLMLSEGFPPAQATAIAFRYYRDGELDQSISMVPDLQGNVKDAYEEQRQERIRANKAFNSARQAAINRYKKLMKLKKIKEKSK